MFKKAGLLLCALCLTAACTQESTTQAEGRDIAGYGIVDLGQKLFFDERLSAEGDMSCESCHLATHGWADVKPFSVKFDGTPNDRHTPTLLNVSEFREWSWDGRASMLEKQILAEWKSQMGGDPEKIAAVLVGDRDYSRGFGKHMGGDPTADRITRALAAFVRTIQSNDSPWDRYEMGDRSAVSEEAKSGFEVFAHKANCTMCHLPPLYTDTLYHNVGIAFDKPEQDRGRGGYLLDMLDGGGSFQQNFDARRLIGAFKTPTMRGITETAPYFHDGSVATLEDAVDLMLKGGNPNRYLDPRIKPKNITPLERQQLLAFLRTLN